MAFDEVRFPESVSFGVKGGPRYKTEVATLRNGYEKRLSCWSLPRYEFEVDYDIQSNEQIEELLAFFHARQGAARGFRFKDWSDFQLEAEEVGEGDGALTEFQILKTYISGSQAMQRKISKPVSETVNVYINDVLQESGVSVSYTTGIITFASAPSVGEVVSVSCDFDVPVRFANDSLPVVIEQKGRYRLSALSLVEVTL